MIMLHVSTTKAKLMLCYTVFDSSKVFDKAPHHYWLQLNIGICGSILKGLLTFAQLFILNVWYVVVPPPDLLMFRVEFPMEACWGHYY